MSRLREAKRTKRMRKIQSIIQHTKQKRLRFVSFRYDIVFFMLTSLKFYHVRWYLVLFVVKRGYHYQHPQKLSYQAPCKDLDG
jgi:hypothetical protein